jgi:hypothetical protein
MYSSLEEEDELPEWVRSEKEQFSAYRDKDGDGFLDKDEVSAEHAIIFSVIFSFERVYFFAFVGTRMDFTARLRSSRSRSSSSCLRSRRRWR